MENPATSSKVRRLVQATGWILLFAMVVISIVPPELRPTTFLPHDMEHAAIFFLAGCAFGLGYPNSYMALLVRLSTFTLAIEFTQLWIPGRHARVSDFLVDAFSITVGLSIGTLLARTTQRA